MNPHQDFSPSALEMLDSFRRNRGLIFQMTKRDVAGKYRGSALGLAWSFFNPLVMLAVYTIVFSTVFQAKWGTGTGSKTEFALVLFIGMIVHRVLADAMNFAVTLVLGNVSYVKKVVFPLEVLPFILMGSILFHTAASLLVWAAFYFLINFSLQWTVVFLPLVLAPLVLFSLGVAWIVAALGVYIRDIGQITGVVTTILLFMSPIFYPASRLPEPFRTILYLNPLTFIIEQSRAVLMWGQAPDVIGLLIAYAVGFVTAWAGFVFFQKTRKGFSDVL